MSTMNISLPDNLKSFIDEQVSQSGFGTSSEYVRELIRKDREKLQTHGLPLAGAASGPTASAAILRLDHRVMRMNATCRFCVPCV